MVVDLFDEQPLAERLPRQRAPAGTLHGAGDFAELRLEGVEAAEVLVDGGRELAFGLAAAGRAQVLPEQRVQHVTRQVERERLLEADDRPEVRTRACVG